MYRGSEDAGAAVAPGFDRGPVVGPMVDMVVGGRYRLGGILGRGRTALVYRGTDLAASGAVRAVKMLRPSLQNDAAEAAALLAEGARMQALAHPRIASVYEAGVAAGVPFCVMEALEGGSVRDITRRHRPLAPARVADLLEGAAEAMSFLHARGWVHADIKPGNLLRDHRGASKLIDFGSARRRGEKPGQARERIVTPAYAAPEVMAGAVPEPRDDVFALAIVAYELMTGRHPFEYRPALATDRAAPPPGLSRRGQAWLGAALAPARAERPADPRGLIGALRAGHPLTRLVRRLSPCPA